MTTSLNDGGSGARTVVPHLWAICSDFESRWHSGDRPDIEEFLQLTRPDDRSTLLTLLIRIDVRERIARGETPDASDYVTRFPTDRATILGIDWTGLSHADGAGRPVADASTILYPMPRRSRIGRFDLRDRLGVGGFGEVWRAFDTHLQRDVAIKIGHYGTDDSAQVDMLLHEARSAGRLRHPGIVPVHEAAVEDRIAYIVSDFIPGMTLSEKLKAGPLGFHEAAGIARKLAEAIAHAHERGIIHRDLKPANVLLDQSGEPHLTDFGVARRAAGDTTISKDGQALGTPAYMAPEQARGETAVVDHRADVYSNGLILFEMLAGRRAYPGDAREALQRVLLGPPQRLRVHRPDIPADLETVVEISIARDPADRYQSAEAQAEDLARYLRGQPITARRGQWLNRGWHWARRRPLTAAALTLAAVLVFAGSMFAVPDVRGAFDGSRASASDSDRESSRPSPALADDPPAPRTRLEPGFRRVLIQTDPPGATVWLFPLNHRTGWPEAERRVELPGKSPAWVELLPGEYLIVGDLGGGRFNEVTRWVPYDDQKPFSYENLRWTDLKGGGVKLHFPIPQPYLARRLVEFDASDEFQVESGNGTPPRRLHIPAFQMARQELTVAEYVAVPGPKRVTVYGQPNMNAVSLWYDEAAVALERIGLRLPCEYEWEYAARFDTPNLDAIAAAERERTTIGPVGTPAIDQIGPAPGVLGLYSNVAEYTSARDSLPWQDAPPGGRHLDGFDRRIVRGGNEAVQNGSPVVNAASRDSRQRHIVKRSSLSPGVGVRGVRSPRPRRNAEDFVRDLGPVASEAPKSGSEALSRTDE